VPVPQTAGTDQGSAENEEEAGGNSTMNIERQTEAKPTETRAVPMVSYLRLPQTEGEAAHLIGSRCGHCGETYLGHRALCINCDGQGPMEELSLGQRGELFTFTVIYQSAPWVQTPYVAAVVKLPEGPVVRASLTGIEPDPVNLEVGMPLEMITETVRRDEDGNDVVAFKYKPVA
jgi:uncharacterized OB-fold protein